MEHKVKIVYQTPDGKVFNTFEEANAYIEPQQSMKARELLQAASDLYNLKGWPHTECNCRRSMSYSDKCLVHFCSCEAGKCARHTNLHFKNNGCWKCGYTDCSLHNCANWSP